MPPDREIADAWTGVILKTLYEKHPRKQDLYWEDVAALAGAAPNGNGEEFFDDVIDWLLEQNLVKLHDKNRLDGHVFSAALTKKAVSALDADNQSLGGKIGDALSRGVQAITTETGKQLISGGVAALISVASKL